MQETNNLGPSWKQQRVWKKKTIPLQEEILVMAKRFDNLQHRALFLICYLTAGRISEVVKVPYLKVREYHTEILESDDGTHTKRVSRTKNGSPRIKKTTKKEINYTGICKNNIFFTEKKGKQILEINLQNRKNKHFIQKRIPIPIHKEKELVYMLKGYIDSLHENQPLFDFGTEKARNIMKKIGMNPHYLRDIRLTHMVTLYDFNAFQLAKFAGWKNAQPAERYVRLGYTDLVDKY